jgi:hypothetical protein
VGQSQPGSVISPTIVPVCQPDPRAGCADHEAGVFNGGTAVGDPVEHITVEQHPVGVELVASQVDRSGHALGQIDPP